jgi:hypothetical protein
MYKRDRPPACSANESLGARGWELAQSGAIGLQIGLCARPKMMCAQNYFRMRFCCRWPQKFSANRFDFFVPARALNPHRQWRQIPLLRLRQSQPQRPQCQR